MENCKKKERSHALTQNLQLLLIPNCYFAMQKQLWNQSFIVITLIQMKERLPSKNSNLFDF